MEDKELTPEELQSFVDQVDFEEFEKIQSGELKLEDTTQTTEDSEPNQDETQDTSTDTGSTEGEENQELSDAEFRRIVTSKFKANGKDMEVTDPNDIVRLMQFGSNYHKKMAEIAPNRKLLKALQDNGLLQEDKINDLIALSKGDKTAIAKYLQDNEVDTYDLPNLEETPYERKDYIPSDESITWEESKNEMFKTNSGKEVLNYLGNIDLDSFSLVRDDPSIMETLRDHVESGIFKETQDKIDYLRMTGNLPEYDSNGNRYKDLDVYAYFAKQIEDSRKSKEPVIIGSNRQKESTQIPNQQKQSASIPSNKQPSYSGMQEMINTNEFDKYETWEDFAKQYNLL